MTRPVGLLSFCVVLALAGCNKQGPEPPMTATDDVEAASVAAEPAPVLAEPPPMPDASPNAVTVGGELDGTGAAVGAKPVYGIGDTVYASVPTAGHAVGDSVRVYWTNETGETDKEESGTIEAGEDFVAFGFSRADGMQPGSYNVQVDVNHVPVGIADFEVE